MISVDLRSRAAPSGSVVLCNSGADAVRVFATGNRWGDEALSFEVIAAGSAARIARAPQVYTANVPVTALIPPGGRYEIAFDLSDGSWETDAVGAALAAPGAMLVAVYEILPSPEALEQQVWTGAVRSAPVPLQ